MRRSRLATAFVAASLVVAACGDSSTPSSNEVTVRHAWARTTPKGATNGVVYFTITSPTDDAILSASVPLGVAKTAEVHETMGGGGAAMPNMPGMESSDGKMTMTPVAEMPLKAHTAVVFQPGGKHVMLMGLARPLEAGHHVLLMLTLKSGAKVEVDALVADNPPT